MFFLCRPRPAMFLMRFYAFLMLPMFLLCVFYLFLRVCLMCFCVCSNVSFASLRCSCVFLMVFSAFSMFFLCFFFEFPYAFTSVSVNTQYLLGFSGDTKNVKNSVKCQ